VGNTTSYNHDERGRVISETAPDGGRTTYVYDTRDNLVELIDANRHTTRFTYDRSNRQLSETRPGGQRLSYTYDGAGNLKTQTDGNGRHTIHTYDGLERGHPLKGLLSRKRLRHPRKNRFFLPEQTCQVLYALIVSTFPHPLFRRFCVSDHSCCTQSPIRIKAAVELRRA
jgi:YD repeat-containing protein